MKKLILDLSILTLAISLFAACSNGESRETHTMQTNEVSKSNDKKTKSIKEKNTQEYTTLPITSEEFIFNYKLNFELDSLEIINESNIEEFEKYNRIDLNSNIDDDQDNAHSFFLQLNKKDNSLKGVICLGNFDMDTFVSSLKALDIYNDRVIGMVNNVEEQINEKGHGKGKVELEKMIVDLSVNNDGYIEFKITGTQK